MAKEMKLKAMIILQYNNGEIININGNEISVANGVMTMAKEKCRKQRNGVAIFEEISGVIISSIVVANISAILM